MSKSYRDHREEVKASKRARGWLKGELCKFREDERATLADLIDAAASDQNQQQRSA